MINPLIKFHANFIKQSGPMVTGEIRLQFDVPEIFGDEVEGIVRILRNKNLLIVIYNLDDYLNVEENNDTTAKVEETLN